MDYRLEERRGPGRRYPPLPEVLADWPHPVYVASDGISVLGEVQWSSRHGTSLVGSVSLQSEGFQGPLLEITTYRRRAALSHEQRLAKAGDRDPQQGAGQEALRTLSLTVELDGVEMEFSGLGLGSTWTAARDFGEYQVAVEARGWPPMRRLVLRRATDLPALLEGRERLLA